MSDLGRPVEELAPGADAALPLAGRLVGPPAPELAPSAIDAALSVAVAAVEAGERPALIADGEQLDFAALAARIAALDSLPPGAIDAVVGTPGIAAALAIYRAAEQHAAVALIHPRWPESQRAALRTRLPDRAPDGAFAIVATSGSSGAPRAVVLSRRMVIASALASAAALGWRDDDRWLCALPLAHVGGLSILVRCLAARRTVVLAARSDPAALTALIADQRITLVSLVPTQLAALIDHGHRAPAHLRCVLLGGASAPPALLARAAAAGFVVRATYGMTETASMVVLDGRPLAGVELAVDGERIFVRGPMVEGRALPPDALPIDRDGWLDSGDRGRIENDRLIVAGRADDMIVSGGENVHPAEVEQRLAALPGVRAVAVFGLPDPRWGELVACALVTDDARLPAGLDRALADLASFQRPRHIVVLPELPLNGTGKVDRHALRRETGSLP